MNATNEILQILLSACEETISLAVLHLFCPSTCLLTVCRRMSHRTHGLFSISKILQRCVPYTHTASLMNTDWTDSITLSFSCSYLWLAVRQAPINQQKVSLWNIEKYAKTRHFAISYENTSLAAKLPVIAAFQVQANSWCSLRLLCFFFIVAEI